MIAGLLAALLAPAAYGSPALPSPSTETRRGPGAWTLERVLGAVRAGEPGVIAARRAAEASRRSSTSPWTAISSRVRLEALASRSDDPALLFARKLQQGRFTAQDFGLDALNDPDLRQAASQPPLSDIKTLASGFKDLSLQAVPPPPPAAAYVAVPPPVQQQQKAAVARIYTGTEPGVIPPVAIVQDFPKFPGRVPSGGIAGAVEIVIDQNGNVESATMQTPVLSGYDNIVVSAARNWKYRPARVNGQPVKSRKSIRITVVPERIGTN